MFKPNYNSIYKDHANQILHWVPMDTKELYQKNLKENYQLLKENNWIDNHFTYKFNSHGFRCEEFTTEPSVMFLGCSHTCGIGLPIDTIWPELVSQQLNMRCANLGIGSSSNDTAFRLCHGWIDIIRPKIVMILEPNDSRAELIDFPDIHNLGYWTLSEESNNKKSFYNFYRTWIKDENNLYFQKLRNKLAIENLCNSRNIKLISADRKDLPCVFTNKDLARDLAHRGIKSHKQIADYFLSKI